MVLIEVFCVTVILGYFFYKWGTATFNTWRDRGVPYEKPTFLIGNINIGTLLGKTSFLRIMIDRYLKFKDSKIYGTYNMRDPILMIRDIEIIKKITIKDFDAFANHKTAFSNGGDNIFTKSLLALRDQKWKEMRNTLTPTFTGNKMRLMFQLINDCSIEGAKYIEEEIKASNKNEIDMEMKEYFTKYANDVIATAAFGIKVNSFTNPKNEFFVTGSALMTFRGYMFFKAMLYSLIPRIMKALGIKLMDENRVNYLRNLVFEAMKYRQQHHVVRPDMIHLLMEAKKQFEETKSIQTREHAEFNDDDLLAQCVLFFLAGFDTVSTNLSFTSYELAIDPDVQERLYEEIKDVEKELNGKPLNYDVLKDMKYMDMVISESLRKWPPAFATDRHCSTDYKLTDDEGNFLVEIKKGEVIFIPISCIHHDPEYFPNPEKFDPERFSTENKHNIKPNTYIPFGIGPRICIGSRLALMETKAIIFHLISKFKIVPSEKTCRDMMNSLRGVQMQPKERFWVKFIPREN